MEETCASSIICVGVDAGAQRRITSGGVSRAKRTSFSSPVRYPMRRLAAMHSSRSPRAAAWRMENQSSMNAFEYVRVAPKSTSSIYF